MGYLGILDSCIDCVSSIDENHGAIVLIDPEFVKMEKSSKYERMVRDVAWLVQKGVDKVLLMDDEMCTVYYDRIQTRFSRVLFINGLSSVVRKLSKSDYQHLLVISGEECAFSRFYKTELRKLNPSILIEQVQFETYRQKDAYAMNPILCDIMVKKLLNGKNVDAVVFGASCFNSLAGLIKLPVVEFQVKLDNAFYGKETYIFATDSEDVLAYEGRDKYQLTYPIDHADVNDVYLY